MQFDKFRKFENAHIFLWLIKDICWVTISRTLGVAMILPIFILAVYITWIHRQIRSEFVHNLAVCFWICANSVWMIGEFYYDDGLRPYAIVFFISGLLVVLMYYVSVVLKLLRSR